MVAHREAGLTLVELMCAFVVVSVLALGASAGRREHTGGVVRALQETVALRAAQSRLEALRVGPVPALGDTELPLQAEEAAHLPQARCTRRVHEVRPGLREVAVRVEWRQDSAASPAAVTLTTLVGLEEQR